MAADKYEKFILVKIRVNLYSHLGWKILLGKKNQKSSRVMRNFLLYALIISHPRV